MKRVAALFAVLALAGCSPAPMVTTPDDLPVTSAPAEDDASPTRDLGAGTPGAGCATNRLGKQFTLNGVRYTCKGPKPYAWRRDTPSAEPSESATAVDVQDGIPCQDGSTSHAKSRRGACSHHGGIA